jgi:hypothetical protein
VPFWCHSFSPSPANTPDSNNHLIVIFSSECSLINQLCLLGMEKKCDINQAPRTGVDWGSHLCCRCLVIVGIQTYYCKYCSTVFKLSY